MRNVEISGAGALGSTAAAIVSPFGGAVSLDHPTVTLEGNKKFLLGLGVPMPKISRWKLSWGPSLGAVVAVPVMVEASIRAWAWRSLRGGRLLAV
jgi:hypothetical protein